MRKHRFKTVIQTMPVWSTCDVSFQICVTLVRNLENKNFVDQALFNPFVL